MTNTDANSVVHGGEAPHSSDEARPVSSSVEPSRLMVIWRSKWRMIAAAAFVCVITFVLTGLQPTRYSAQSTVLVSLVSAQDSAQQTALAQNDLAAQFAQLASTQPVKESAAKALHISTGQLGTISASPINAYNIVGITVMTSAPSDAVRQSRVLAYALMSYVRKNNVAQAARVDASVAPQLHALDEQISILQNSIAIEQKQLADFPPSMQASSYANILPGQLSLLSSLTSQRSNIFTAQQRTLTASQPTLSIVDLPTVGTGASKHQLLYAGVAFLVVLLGMSEIIVFAARLRRTPSPEGK